MTVDPPRVLIAGTHSSVGKTTVCVGLLAALRRGLGRGGVPPGGLNVAPFKAGPDYIDPTLHSAVADRPCRNLDAWLLPEPALRGVLRRGARGADLALIEGVMGLFDGIGSGQEGSTAAVARALDCPVVLVLDVAGMSTTAAAIVLGCQRMRPRVRLAGVILNRVGNAAHAESTAEAIRQATGLPTLGYLPDDPSLGVPERHLGLVPATERALPAATIDRLAALVSERFDLAKLRAIAEAAGPLNGTSGDVPGEGHAPDAAGSAGERSRAGDSGGKAGASRTHAGDSGRAADGGARGDTRHTGESGGRSGDGARHAGHSARADGSGHAADSGRLGDTGVEAGDGHGYPAESGRARDSNGNAGDSGRAADSGAVGDSEDKAGNSGRYARDAAQDGSVAPVVAPGSVRVAVARDRAFGFYYADTFDILADLGAEVVSFSPLDDDRLPPYTDAVYLGGGFPELYAADIAANDGMRAALRDFARRGGPIYAECGGLMALGAALVTFEGERLPGFGLLPLVSRMSREQLTIGYREVEALRPSVLFERGQRMRGHEFHWSTADDPPAAMAAYRVLPNQRLEGYCVGAVLGSYVHLNFAASAGPLARFVRAAERARA